MTNLSTPAAIVVAGAMIAAAILFAGRYEITTGPGQLAYRLDQWTGRVAVCLPSKSLGLRCQ